MNLSRPRRRKAGTPTTRRNKRLKRKLEAFENGMLLPEEQSDSIKAQYEDFDNNERKRTKLG